MRRFVKYCTLLLSARNITTKAFVSKMEKIQQQLQSGTEHKNELIDHGRMLFENELIDDVETAWSPEQAAKICHVASQLRISMIRGQPFEAVVQECTSVSSERKMDNASLARIIHSCLLLRSPVLFDLLFTYINHIILHADEMDAVTLAVLINAYGRAEVHHDKLYRTLCDAAAVKLKDPRLSLAHVANVAHALSRIHFVHKPLLLVLREHALRMCAEAPVIVAVTILDAFAELDFVDSEVFDAYEQRLLDRIDELQAPLMTALLSCLATAKRATPKLLEVLGERVIAIVDTFDPVSIARTCDAYFRADVLAEDVFGALAERACKVALEFRNDEVHLMLNALSAFDLFDGELYPLLASRVSTLYRQGGFLGVEDAAGILASFAAVQERNDELIHYCTQVFASYPNYAMTPATCINALWACAKLNVRNEAQMQLLDNVRANLCLIRLPGKNSEEGRRINEKMYIILNERRANALREYHIQDTDQEANKGTSTLDNNISSNSSNSD